MPRQVPSLRPTVGDAVSCPAAASQSLKVSGSAGLLPPTVTCFSVNTPGASPALVMMLPQLMLKLVNGATTVRLLTTCNFTTPKESQLTNSKRSKFDAQSGVPVAVELTGVRLGLRVGLGVGCGNASVTTQGAPPVGFKNWNDVPAKSKIVRYWLNCPGPLM